MPPERHGPRAMKDILGAVLAKYDLAGTTGRLELERAWAAAAGPPTAAATRVGALKHGTLEILVQSSILLQELEGFRKEDLLAAVQANVRHSRVTGLRFRKG
jgi:predicted nucleic acid-binding Zn ribbon protein